MTDPTNTARTVAKEMLDAIDAFTGGKKMTAEQTALEEMTFTAGCYAAAAYEAHAPKSGGEDLSLTRAFLLALIDPLHEDLDYLRVDPASGAARRKARMEGGDA